MTGFSIVPDVFRTEEVDEILRVLQQVTGRSRAGARHLLGHPAVAQLAHDPRLMRVLPGTHTLGVLDDAAIQALARRIPARECLVGRGGVVTMRPLLIHASSKSTVAAPRRVLHVEYAASLDAGQGLELAVA